MAPPPISSRSLKWPSMLPGPTAAPRAGCISMIRDSASTVVGPVMRAVAAEAGQGAWASCDPLHTRHTGTDTIRSISLLRAKLSQATICSVHCLYVLRQDKTVYIWHSGVVCVAHASGCCAVTRAGFTLRLRSTVADLRLGRTRGPCHREADGCRSPDGSAGQIARCGEPDAQDVRLGLARRVEGGPRQHGLRDAPGRGRDPWRGEARQRRAVARAGPRRPRARRPHGRGRGARPRALHTRMRTPCHGARRHDRGARHPRRGCGRAPPTDTLAMENDMKMENTKAENNKPEATKPDAK